MSKTVEEIREYQKQYREKNKDRLKSRSKEYHKQWYLKNKDRLLDIGKKYYQEHKPKKNAQSKAYRQANKVTAIGFSNKYKTRIKEEFFTMYGGACSCCGETLREFLTLDHVKGQKGSKKKENTYFAIKNALKTFDSSTYRILCMNCNHSIGIRGYCPHNLTKSLK